jgi:hypothetical protein
MFKIRKRRPIQKRTPEQSSDYEDCLSLSPLAVNASEEHNEHLLSDDRLMQFATIIDGISIPEHAKRDQSSETTLLGSVYEFLRHNSIKREHGIFYTPDSVASMICDLSLRACRPTWGQTDESIDPQSLDDLLNLRVLDNACGSGVFLLIMLENLVGLLQRAAEDNPRACHMLQGLGAYPNDRSALARYVVKQNLHGRDLDETALQIAKTQLWLATCSMNPEHGLFPLPEADLVVMDSLLPNPGESSSFDIVVGNPPYMKTSSLSEKARANLRERYPVRGEYNSHALFVQSGLRQLKKGGVLAYILHKNFFTLDSFRDLRRDLLDSHQCVNLVDCGPGIFKRVTAETGIIVVRNARPVRDTCVGFSKYDRSASCLRPVFTLSQADYLRLVRPWGYRYVLNMNDEERRVLNLLEPLPRLNQFVSIRRGIETGRNKGYLSSSPDEPGNWIPVLRGKDISPFRGRHRLYLNYIREELSKPGPTDLLRTPKLIVQQNSRRPIAYFDGGRFLVLNSATYVSEASTDFLKSVCVFLNSHLIGWFFGKVITNDAGLTVNILPNNLGLIPLPAHFDTSVFAWLCDALTLLSGEPEDNSFKEIESLRSAAEAAVLESYFPRHFPLKHVTQIVSSAARRPMARQSFPVNVGEVKLGAEAALKTFDTSLMRNITGLPDWTHWLSGLCTME